jgi:Zn-dependent peptidase ImmA (M78 family)
MTSLVVSDSESVVSACDEIAEELLAEAGWSDPPVDAFRLAADLGYEIAFDARQQARGRFKRLGGRPTMFLSPDDRPERLQWAAAHEIGESAAYRVFELLDVDPHLAETDFREKIAAQLASALLLPRREFEADVARHDGDVPALKAKYATASHELILTSQLRMETLMLASIFDHGELKRRRSNGRLAPPPLMTVERQAQLRAHATGRPVVLTGRGVRVQAWPIHEAGWKRELLRTTPLNVEDPEDLDIEYDSPGCCDG